MSYYNFLDYQKYQKLAAEARRDGAPANQIEELEKRAQYYWNLMGGDAKAQLKRSRKKGSDQDSKRGGELYYDFDSEWSQVPPDEI